MAVDKKIEHINYPIVKIRLSKPHDNLYEFVVKETKPLLNDKKCIFRIKYINDDIYSYSTESNEDIIKYMIKKIDNIDNIKKEDIVKLTMKNSNKVMFMVANNGLITCVSHLFYDGMSIVNNLKYLYKDKPSLKKYYYIPIYNEIFTIYSLCKSLNKIPKRNLTYDYPQETSSYCNIVKTILPIKSIKQLKKNISDDLKEKISFSIIISTIQVLSIASHNS